MSAPGAEQAACGPDPVTTLVGRFDRVVALGLAAILRDDRRLRVLAGDLDEIALESALIRWAPQVLILAEGVDPRLIARLRTLRPRTGIVVFAHDPSPAEGMRLLGAGANCVALGVADITLLESVRRTARGERFFAATDGERVERRYPANAEALTKREREVFLLLAKGASHAQIALALAVGVRTAETHAARVREKLQVKGKRELIGMPPPERTGAEVDSRRGV